MHPARSTPGQIIYASGQKWLKDNDPTVPLAEWGQVQAIERQYWEAMGRTLQTTLTRQRWDGILCGLTYGFLIAAIVFVVAVSY